MEQNNMHLLQQFSETDFYENKTNNQNLSRLFRRLAETNTQDVTEAIEQKILPKEIHAPTADELEIMAVWMKEYKRLTPKASKREIRKACQAHFNVRIFRKPYKS